MNTRMVSLDRLLFLVMLAILLPAMVGLIASAPDIKRYLRMLEM